MKAFHDPFITGDKPFQLPDSSLFCHLAKSECTPEPNVFARSAKTCKQHSM